MGQYEDSLWIITLWSRGRHVPQQEPRMWLAEGRWSANIFSFCFLNFFFFTSRIWNFFSLSERKYIPWWKSGVSSQLSTAPQCHTLLLGLELTSSINKNEGTSCCVSRILAIGVELKGYSGKTRLFLHILHPHTDCDGCMFYVIIPHGNRPWQRCARVQHLPCEAWPSPVSSRKETSQSPCCPPSAKRKEAQFRVTLLIVGKLR